jgi:parvulin-like peptidyl-prolyl isomerase
MKFKPSLFVAVTVGVATVSLGTASLSRAADATTPPKPAATPAQPPATPPAAPAAPTINPNPPSPDVVASVNGANISRDELTHILLREYGSPALERLIDRKIVEQAAQKQGIQVTQKDLDLEYDALKIAAPQVIENYERQYGKDYVMENVARPQYIIMKIGEKLVKADPSSFDEVKASHILIRPETVDTTGKPQAEADAAKAKADADAKKKADDVMAEAKKPGADFAALAKKYSADTTSAVNGGDLDFFGRGRMMPPFEEAAFNAKVGDIVGPIKTIYGYHIIKVTDRRSADKMTPAQLEAKRLTYYRTNAGEAIQTWINRQRQDAKVQRYPIEAPAEKKP